ncbi:MAG: hypothetical protein ACRD16_05350 [Thermoanaerobaculia bacterium]
MRTSTRGSPTLLAIFAVLSADTQTRASSFVKTAQFLRDGPTASDGSRDTSAANPVQIRAGARHERTDKK